MVPLWRGRVPGVISQPISTSFISAGVPRPRSRGRNGFVMLGRYK